MVATQHQHGSSADKAVGLTAPPTTTLPTEHETALDRVKTNGPTSALLLPGRIVTHSVKAGLNPLVDAAGYLFSIIGKIKHLKSYRHLSKLQTELVQEINLFHDNVKNKNYNPEYLIVCRYVLCAVADDIIANTPWGGQNQWDSYSLLASFNQDTQHHDKFFSILDRAIKDPSVYIDLMELMYISLSLGYKGRYRTTEHSQYQLEQITNNLYKHIRAYRGNFNKMLSPTPLKAIRPTTKPHAHHTSLLYVFFVTACVVMIIFISLGYLMDVISNDAYKNIAQIQNRVSHETAEQ